MAEVTLEPGEFITRIEGASNGENWYMSRLTFITNKGMYRWAEYCRHYLTTKVQKGHGVRTGSAREQRISVGIVQQWFQRICHHIWDCCTLMEPRE